MDSTALYDQFRLDVDDTVAPYLWADTEVYGYIDDAQKMFCRLTGGLGDASSSLTLLSYTAGDNAVALSPLILKIRAAYDSTTGVPVELINVEDMASRALRFDGGTGLVRYLVTGMEENAARVHPVPDAAGAVQLVVERLPLLEVDDTDQDLEVADQHKHGLSLWVRACAYGKQDADTFDAKRADNFAAQFRAYCEDARREKERTRHKTRVVAYGGV
jgi:hypothetical protein